MKKTNRILSLAVAFALAIFALVSCGVGGTVADSGKAKVVIENADKTYTVYEVDLGELTKRDEGAASVLEHLATLEGSTLYYSLSLGGGYGAYVTSIGSLYPDSTHQYVALYTNMEEDFDVASGTSSLTYEGEMLKYAGVGLSSMTVKDGTVILFRLEEF